MVFMLQIFCCTLHVASVFTAVFMLRELMEHESISQPGDVLSGAPEYSVALAAHRAALHEAELQARLQNHSSHPPPHNLWDVKGDVIDTALRTWQLAGVNPAKHCERPEQAWCRAKLLGRSSIVFMDHSDQI